MPFCPNCRSEYVANITQCDSCDVPVVETLDAPDTYEMHDVFLCYSQVSADRVAQLLNSEAIPTLIRDRSSSAFPTQMGTNAERHIAVPLTSKKEAHQLLSDAVKDEVISSNGKLL